MVTSTYIQKVECPNCHRMVKTWSHVEHCLGSKYNEKNYGVMTSGHGSDFVLDEVAKGKPRRYSFREAVEHARHWHGIADTIGGQAQVIDLKTKRTLQHY